MCAWSNDGILTRLFAATSRTPQRPLVRYWEPLANNELLIGKQE